MWCVGKGFFMLVVGGIGRTQVKKALHALPGMHMQQCSAVPSLGESHIPTLLHMYIDRVKLFLPLLWSCFVGQNLYPTFTFGNTLVVPLWLACSWHAIGQPSGYPRSGRERERLGEREGFNTVYTLS